MKAILLIVIITTAIGYYSYGSRNYTRVISVHAENPIYSYPYTVRVQYLDVEIWNEANISIQLPIDPTSCIANFSIIITGADYEVPENGNIRCLESGMLRDPLESGNVAQDLLGLIFVLYREVPDANFSNIRGDGLVKIECVINPDVQQYFGTSYNLTMQTSIGNATFDFIPDPVPDTYGNITNQEEHPLHLRLLSSQEMGHTTDFTQFKLSQTITATVQEKNNGPDQKRTVDYFSYNFPHIHCIFDGQLTDSTCTTRKGDLVSDVKVTYTTPHGLSETYVTTQLYLYVNPPQTLLNFTGTLTLTYYNLIVSPENAFAAYLHYDHGNIISIGYESNDIGWE